MFLTKLAEALPSMTSIKDLKLGKHLYTVGTPEIVAAMAKVILAVIQCPNLKILKIPHSSDKSNCVDKAIFACIRDAPHLDEMTIYCPRTHALDRSGLALLGLDAALKDNFTLTKLHVKVHGNGAGNPCDATTLVMAKVVPRLNAAGRKYMKEDPGNKALGFHVLGSVSDSLDCSYIHLLENPSLCEHAAFGDARRKRIGHRTKRKSRKRQPTASGVFQV